MLRWADLMIPHPSLSGSGPSNPQAFMPLQGSRCWDLVQYCTVAHDSNRIAVKDAPVVGSKPGACMWRRAAFLTKVVSHYPSHCSGLSVQVKAVMGHLLRAAASAHAQPWSVLMSAFTSTPLPLRRKLAQVGSLQDHSTTQMWLFMSMPASEYCLPCDSPAHCRINLSAGDMS